MSSRRLALLWGGRVASEEGWSATLQGASLLPRTLQITHLQLRRGPFRAAQRLPLENARQERDGTVVLPPPRFASGPEARAAGPRRGAVPFGPQTPVHLADGDSAHLRGFTVDAADGSVLGIVVDAGRGPRLVQLEQVDKLASGSPSVLLGQDALHARPIYRPDDRVDADVRAALDELDLAGGSAAALAADVSDGEATLRGHVRVPIQRRQVQAAVERVPGVARVRNEIVADRDLELAVAEALAQEKLYRRGLLLVKSSLGRVRLQGSLPSDELIALAIERARQVPGVRELASEIQLKGPSPSEAAPPPSQAPASL